MKILTFCSDRRYPFDVAFDNPQQSVPSEEKETQQFPPPKNDPTILHAMPNRPPSRTYAIHFGKAYVRPPSLERASLNQAPPAAARLIKPTPSLGALPGHLQRECHSTSSPSLLIKARVSSRHRSQSTAITRLVSPGSVMTRSLPAFGQRVLGRSFPSLRTQTHCCCEETASRPSVPRLSDCGSGPDGEAGEAIAAACT